MPKKTVEEKNEKNQEILEKLLVESGGVKPEEDFEVNSKDGINLDEISDEFDRDLREPTGEYYLEIESKFPEVDVEISENLQRYLK